METLVETLDKYRFNEKEHIHQILVDGEWKNLYGISSVVKHISNFGIAAYYGSRRALMELGYDPKEAKVSTSDKEAKEWLGKFMEAESKRKKHE